MDADPVTEVLDAGSAAGARIGSATRLADRTRLARDLLTLLRPAQWAKNLLVVPLPLVEASTWNLGELWRIGWAVGAFCAVSSLGYVVNDVADRYSDARHPAKRHRPIAAGRVPPRLAWAYAGCLTAVLCALLIDRPARTSWPILVYLGLSTAYNRKLKHVPLVDVFTVATGFVLRLVQGYVAVGAHVDGSLATCVFALCLLLILGKRRNELVVHGPSHRNALRGYSVPLVDQLAQLCAAVAITTYLLHLKSEAALGAGADTAVLAATPFAIFAMFRYFQILIIGRGGGDPVRVLLRDRVMAANLLLWGLFQAVVLVSIHYPAAVRIFLDKVV